MDTQAQFIKIMRSFVADEPPALDGGSLRGMPRSLYAVPRGRICFPFSRM